ncbi:hypothetical protein DPV78_006389 [Talaromyces pinophilus]|nr:hypothetical protein DPV78_006389 [Talaromyces pinophilus]
MGRGSSKFDAVRYSTHGVGGMPGAWHVGEVPITAAGCIENDDNGHQFVPGSTRFQHRFIMTPNRTDTNSN